MTTAHLGPFTIYELRRYTLVDGERDAFVTYFETFLQDAAQQLGALFLGQFRDRRRSQGFVMLRGFRTLDERAVANAAFYYGPIWKEHRQTMNDRLVDWHDVLLLRPASGAQGVPVLPAVDPLREPAGARGIVAAQIYAVVAGAADEFARRAAPVFARWAQAGARPAGLLVTVDEPNNYPQLPVREDGPYVVWLGILPPDPDALETFERAVVRSESRLSGLSELRAAPQSMRLDPTRRSRLRWGEEPIARGGADQPPAGSRLGAALGKPTKRTSADSSPMREMMNEPARTSPSKAL